MESVFTYGEARVIAECCGNHQGDMDVAKRMIEAAAASGAWAAKFQKRDPDTFKAMTYPHPCAEQSFGRTYGEHRARLEFTPEQHVELQRVCRDNGIHYSSSVWDVRSMKEITALAPPYIKIPAARNTRTEIARACAPYPPLHVSLGMLSHDEIPVVAEAWPYDTVFYAATSGYPIAFGEACLLEIPRLPRPCGWSSHVPGTIAEIAAYTLGATYIEKHFTLDRSAKGTDQANSLEPMEFAKLVGDLRDVREALTMKPITLMEIERVQKEKLS